MTATEQVPLTDEQRAGLQRIKAGLADTSLISYAPCGCWMSVMIESLDFADNAKDVAEFMRDMERGGGGRVERIPSADFRAIRNGVNGDLKWGCDHEPKWGGITATHRLCPRCQREFKVKKDGTLAAHKAYRSRYAPHCSQEPWTAEAAR